MAGSVPEDVLDKLGRLGRELSTMTVLCHARIAEQLGLSPTDHTCLELIFLSRPPSPHPVPGLRASEPLTAGQIAQQSGLSTGAVTGVIDRLERRGLVRRVRDPHDRRKVLVEVVQIDKSEHTRPAADLTARVITRFTPDEWDVIERFNRAMLDEYHRLLERA